MRSWTLTKLADFRAAYDTGLKQVSGGFVLFWRRTDRKRYAVVASKKTIGNAVRRNRSKRLLRELLRAADKTGGAWTGDLIMVARAGLLRQSFAELLVELEKCLRRWRSA